MENLKKLVLLHSNDLHGDFLSEENDKKLIGGVSLLSGYISQTRREEPNTLYCIAGDMFRGSVIDSEYQGISTIEIMNTLSPDVVTVGNHETDYGLAHLLFLEKCAKFPIINANLYIRTNHARLFRPHVIIEVDGMKILFIGILTEEVLAQTKNDGLVGTFVNVEEAATEVGKICNTYNATDIDLTVLLTHIGFEEDKKLARQLDPAWGVDVIIGGHSHTFLEKPEVVNGVLIVQAGVGTDQIGRFDLTVNTDENRVTDYQWQCIPIDSAHCPRDKELEDLIETYKSKTDEKYSRVITRFHKKLTHPARTRETELGNLFADIMKRSLNIDLMLLGSGSIRCEELGPILLYSDLCEAFPYDDEIYMLTVTGETLKKMIFYMLRDEVWEGAHCEFYQFSEGMQVVYSREKHEFITFSLGGVPVENNRVYTVGLQRYHYKNTQIGFGMTLDELTTLRKARILATSCREILDEYLSSHQRVDSNTENRLVVI
ncbi:MAG: 5'-nucleotidase C-terminal domain-containing protein [Clostridia bacterium]|nr:5'-nucleotidase C-terminal domain-containing protein [Clostridia bacterium]